MELKLFYRTQRELAIAINKVVDAYWINEINEQELVSNIHYLYDNNYFKMLKDGEFPSVLNQQCGKRRLQIVERILNVNKDSLVKE